MYVPCENKRLRQGRQEKKTKGRDDRVIIGTGAEGLFAEEHGGRPKAFAHDKHVLQVQDSAHRKRGLPSA